MGRTYRRKKEWQDKGCKEAKILGYDGGCLTCPFEECIGVLIDSGKIKKKDILDHNITMSWTSEELD